jgi:hypothetical protein
MASTVGFVPGTIIRWRKRCFVVVDCDGMDTIIVQEHGKGGFERIPVREALPGHGPCTGTTQSVELYLKGFLRTFGANQLFRRPAST